MSLAAETREAVQSQPFLYEALRAGIVNYAAAARLLAVSDDTDAVATALRRYATELPEDEPRDGTVRITMQSGLTESEIEPVLKIGGHGFGVADGNKTGIHITGAVSPRLLANSLLLLAINGIPIAAAGITGEQMIVVVPRRDGSTALRYVETAFDSFPV